MPTFDEPVPDDRHRRAALGQRVYEWCQPFELVVVVPTLGIEPHRFQRDKPGSANYVFSNEIRKLYSLGKSLLIRQRWRGTPGRPTKVLSGCKKRRGLWKCSACPLAPSCTFSHRSRRGLSYFASECCVPRPNSESMTEPVGIGAHGQQKTTVGHDRVELALHELVPDLAGPAPGPWAEQWPRRRRRALP
jgi:hypothetical protein